MGVYLIKPDPNEDFYVEWDERVDAPIAYGGKAEFQGYDPEEYNDKRFERADSTGSSYMLNIGKWDDEEIQLVEAGTSTEWWNVPRHHLKELSIGLVQNWDDKDKQQEFIDKYCTKIIWEADEFDTDYEEE